LVVIVEIIFYLQLNILLSDKQLTIHNKVRIYSRQDLTNLTSDKPTLFLLFNHRLTAAQEADARTSLGVDRIVLPPPEICTLWMEIPPDAGEIVTLLAPVFAWLRACAWNLCRCIPPLAVKRLTSVWSCYSSRLT
jgi:hypothetical protein